MDIHDLSAADPVHGHSVISAAQEAQLMSDPQAGQADHEPHCSVCSYDHGGHIGQTLATVFYQTALIPGQIPLAPLHSDFWYSRPTPPRLRPPIIL